ncbi:MAG: lysostaphin resistance A-like protein [Bacteroidales bacterium]
MLMLRILFESFLHVILIISIVFLILKEKSKVNYQRILIFAFCYIVYQLFLSLPAINDEFNFIESRWNWEGKIFGIIWGITSYFLFRRFFHENDFFTLKQNKKSYTQAMLVCIIYVTISTIIWFLFDKPAYDLESLIFELTLPGIDEEIIFRGIILGLFASSLKNKIPFIGNPSILLTAVLFALSHALSVKSQYVIDFNLYQFLQTGFTGYILGWVTIKSRSILLALLTHNLSNFLGALSTLIK